MWYSYSGNTSWEFSTNSMRKCEPKVRSVSNFSAFYTPQCTVCFLQHTIKLCFWYFCRIHFQRKRENDSIISLNTHSRARRQFKKFHRYRDAPRLSSVKCKLEVYYIICIVEIMQPLSLNETYALRRSCCARIDIRVLRWFYAHTMNDMPRCVGAMLLSHRRIDNDAVL